MVESARSAVAGADGQRGQRLPPGPRVLSREVIDAHQRNRILDAMLELIIDQGYEASSVSRVSKHAGVSTATFYQLFGNRADAFWQMYDMALESLLRPALDIWEESEASVDGSTRLRASLSTLLSTMAAKPDLARVVIAEAAWLGPEVFERREQQLRPLAERIEHAIGDQNGSSSPFAARAIVAAAWEMIEEHVAAGTVSKLPELTDDLYDVGRAVFDHTGQDSSGRISAGALARYQRVLDQVYGASRELILAAPSWQAGLYASLRGCYTQMRSHPESLWLHFIETDQEETVAVRSAHSARLLTLLHELREDAPSKQEGSDLLKQIHGAMRESILQNGDAIDLDAAEGTFAHLLFHHESQVEGDPAAARTGTGAQRADGE
ncbi:TetR/AcrR family transcriptional regulator [Leucobacter weissii]|uniref:TetR/AcrR family transcriptional regulator n=1 Tax=Leucobacter weissii TaxID=1983706 RepID=A0A939MKM4_9MICO|nr:TetR/AcrR family transcriptional regulator [Leucobacter weissii]MBO1901680.1 TetR/AcrR family transcriptional regulator [Leucobacter weissii]